MGRDLAAVAEEGVEACVRGDRARATQLVAELISALDLTHAAARPVCDLYEEALGELVNGRFEAARALFHALRTV
jgi:hypothetical protein